jgi:hypothetical protein
MKISKILLLAYLVALLSSINALNAASADTVIIELTNKSKIVIYTSDREELKGIEKYDLNQMIKDLNGALGSKKIEKIELTDESGKKYLKDTTIVIGDKGAKTRIKIGNMELLVDADEWDNIDDVIEESLENDEKFKRFTFEEQSEDRTKNNFNMDIGINNWMEGGSFPDANNAAYRLNPKGSWYLALNSTYNTWVTGPLFIDWGFGVSWYNFNLQDTDYKFSQGANELELIKAPIEFNTVKSRLTVPYVNAMFVPMFDFAKGKRKVDNREKGSLTFRTYKKQGLRFGAGPYVGYRVGGNTKFKYKENGDMQKEKFSDSYYLQNVRYGIRAQFGFKGLDLFATYDLNEVFSSGKGPAGSSGLNAMSFGITF